MKYITLPEHHYNTLMDAAGKHKEDILSGIDEGIYEDSIANREETSAIDKALSYQPTVDEVPEPVTGYVPAVFYVDGDDCAYVGVHDNTVSWNGWSVPYFTKKVAELILNAMKRAGVCDWHMEGESFVMAITDGSGDDPITWEPVQINDETMYSIGGYFWCWSYFADEPTFLWKDKSGRGFKETISLTAILENEENLTDHIDMILEENDDEQSLITWASNCEVGDEWTDNANHYTRLT